jgi:transposase InsO family protein
MNRAWVGDITYIATAEGWLYLAVIMDLASRRIVGWAMSERIKADLVCQALRMAYWRRKPGAGLIMHTDRGSQYASDPYRSLIKDYGMVQSMSRKANCWDTQSRIYTERPVQSDSCWDWHHAFALTCRLDRGVPRLLPGPSFVT